MPSRMYLGRKEGLPLAAALSMWCDGLGTQWLTCCGANITGCGGPAAAAMSRLGDHPAATSFFQLLAVDIAVAGQRRLMLLDGTSAASLAGA